MKKITSGRIRTCHDTKYTDERKSRCGGLIIHRLFQMTLATRHVIWVYSPQYYNANLLNCKDEIVDMWPWRSALESNECFLVEPSQQEDQEAAHQERCQLGGKAMKQGRQDMGGCPENEHLTIKDSPRFLTIRETGTSNQSRRGRNDVANRCFPTTTTPNFI